jgi:hypothetical protein
MKVLIIVEPTDTGFSAYAPDVPGCVAAGPDREFVECEMRDAHRVPSRGAPCGGVPGAGAAELCDVRRGGGLNRVLHFNEPAIGVRFDRRDAETPRRTVVGSL